jgi:hypothetical protein
MFLIQQFSKREIITNLTRKIDYTQINDSNENDNIIIKVNNLKLIDNFWLDEKGIETLFNLVKEKIFSEFKARTYITNEKNDNNMPTFPSLTEDNLDIISPSKVDEVNDFIDFIKIPEILDDNLSNNINSKGYYSNKNNNNTREDLNSNNFNNRNINNNGIKSISDDFNFEELGVFEVEDEIFENFDEENIPIIKNIYKRKKGSAEKLKTNQNTRNLLMSTQNYNNNNQYYRNETHNNTNRYNMKENILEENKNNLDKLDEDMLPDLKSKKSKIYI